LKFKLKLSKSFFHVASPCIASALQGGEAMAYNGLEEPTFNLGLSPEEFIF